MAITDGLDGLAIGCTLIVSVAFLFLTYFAGNARVAGYLQIPYVPGAGELTVVCAAMIGAGLLAWVTVREIAKVCVLLENEIWLDPHGAGNLAYKAMSQFGTLPSNVTISY